MRGRRGARLSLVLDELPKWELALSLVLKQDKDLILRERVRIQDLQAQLLKIWRQTQAKLRRK